MNLHVCIMTPDQVFWNDDADELILPTNTGQMGVLPQHAALITALEIGVISIRQKGVWTFLALMNGFASVQRNQVTILVNAAESKKTIDPTEAEKQFVNAQQQLEAITDQKQKVEALLAFKRARARFSVSKN